MTNRTFLNDSPLIDGSPAVPSNLQPGTPPLRLSNTIRYGAGNLSTSLITQVFATLVIFYYVDTLGANPQLIALAMVLHGIFNAILNPIFGHISDRTRSRWGRRLPYVMFGSIPLAAVFTMVWIPLASSPTGLFWYFLGVVAVYDILFVLVVLNYGAIFPEMFITEKERAQGASWRQMFAVVGMILGVALGPVLYGILGWPGMGITLGVVAVIGLVVAVTGTTERRPATVDNIGFFQAIVYTFKNKAFLAYVTGSLLIQVVVALLPASVPFFTKYVLGDPDPVLQSVLLGTIFIVAVPSVYLWGFLIGKFGAWKAMLATIVVFVAGLLPFSFVSTLTWTIAAAVIVGIAVAGIMVLLDVLLAEVIDIDADKTGIRREGMYLGINGFIVRWSVSIQAIIFGLILPWSGYHEGALSQPETVATGIRLMISGIPVIVLMLAFAAFWFYPHRKRQLTKESMK